MFLGVEEGGRTEGAFQEVNSYRRSVYIKTCLGNSAEPQFLCFVTNDVMWPALNMLFNLISCLH